jgi:hypothetical protein
MLQVSLAIPDGARYTVPAAADTTCGMTLLAAFHVSKKQASFAHQQQATHAACLRLPCISLAASSRAMPTSAAGRHYTSWAYTSTHVLVEIPSTCLGTLL